MAQKENFLKAHYDVLAAGAGVIVLVFGLLSFLPGAGVDPDEAAADYDRSLEGRVPSQSSVAPVDMSLFARAYKDADKPPVLMDVDVKKANFLASERRVLCTPAADAGQPSCNAPIPAGLDKCPVCGARQISLVKIEMDFDHDGLPNDWEKKYGLNPHDAADAALDADGDGFTNAEEFKAGTDPRDKASHPDVLAHFSVASDEIRTTYLPFYFKEATPIPGGRHRFTFYRTAVKDIYNSKYTPTEGEEIGKSGFIVKSYAQKTEERVIKGSKNNLKKTVSVDTVEIERKSDGKLLTLVVNQKRTPVDMQVDVAYASPWALHGTTNATVQIGSELTLPPGCAAARVYRVVDLRETAAPEKDVLVTIEDIASPKKTRTVIRRSAGSRPAPSSDFKPDGETETDGNASSKKDVQKRK